MGDQNLWWFRPRVISECHSNNRGSKKTVSVECIEFKRGNTFALHKDKGHTHFISPCHEWKLLA